KKVAFRSAANQSTETPSFCACSTTLSSYAFKNKSNCFSYKSWSFSVVAASSPLSASYNSTPKYLIRPVHVSEQPLGPPASIRGKQNVHFSALFVFQLK